MNGKKSHPISLIFLLLLVMDQKHRVNQPLSVDHWFDQDEDFPVHNVDKYVDRKNELIERNEKNHCQSSLFQLNEEKDEEFD